MVNISHAAETQFTKLIEFRQAAYACLGNGRDALFELADAVMLTPALNSFAELACAPVFRRCWPSLYEALQDGRPDQAALMRLYISQMPMQGRPLLAGDHTAWPRLTAPTVADRTVQHAPTKIAGNLPITIGHGYSTLNWVPEAQGSWAPPLLLERISSAETPHQKGASQLRRVSAALQGHGARPISLWDAEYGCAPFILATADIPADKLVRLRPNLCLYGPEPPYGGRGRPAVHGPAFKLNYPLTWGQPASKLELVDSDLGRVQILVWRQLHFRKAAAHPLIVVRIERLDARHTRRDPGVLWLAWLGEEPPALAMWWAWYLRRFAVDHWYRFAKQRLHWTLPHLATPEQAERWSGLLPLITWQLWLAREIVGDSPLPWQKPQPRQRLTPGRVCQGMGGVLATIGTPARAPKPRGKAPGWPKGRPRKLQERHPVVKKGAKKRKRAA